jgi:hypothetical protein
MEVIGLQKMLKLIILVLETQTDTMFLARNCYSQEGKRGHVEIQTEGNGTSRAGSHMVSITNCYHFPISPVNYCVIYT